MTSRVSGGFDGILRQSTQATDGANAETAMTAKTRSPPTAAYHGQVEQRAEVAIGTDQT